MKTIIILFVSVVAVHCANLTEIPDFLTICHDDAGLTDCVRKNVEDLRPYFRDGYKPIDLPHLNPFRVDKLVVSSKSSGLLLQVENLDVWNAHNYTINDLKVIEHRKKYYIDVSFPQYYINGTYTIDGQLLLLKLEGKGFCEGTVEKVRGRFTVVIDKKPRDDGEFTPYVKSLNVKISYGKARIYMDNLFGDKALSDTINEAVNGNIDLFVGELMPLIEKRFNVIFSNAINRMSSHFTMSQWFP